MNGKNNPFVKLLKSGPYRLTPISGARRKSPKIIAIFLFKKCRRLAKNPLHIRRDSYF
jgi:hypothetical protein